jgi:nucleoside-diphosphate-sugar epimerase
MRTALIGYTGFVGGNLARQAAFDDCYRSTTIEDITGRHYDLIVCSGAPAEKWRANRDPEADARSLGRLASALARVTAGRFVLVSTVDVFANPVGVDESFEPAAAAGNHYGNHRRDLERFVAGRFDALVLRLPALFGPGLKKNAVYDLLHGNQVGRLHRDAVFQFYDVGRLWRDTSTALDAGLKLLHLATEPVSLAEVAAAAFGVELPEPPADVTPARYDLRTRHADLFVGRGGYVCDRAAVLAGLRSFVETERGARRCA